MDEQNLKSVISIVVSRLKRSEDSLEVFKAVLNLSIASKSFKNYLNDKLLVELSYRYVKDRTQFVKNRLKYYIRSNNFDKFAILADLVVAHYSKLEGVQTLNNLLEYVTKHATCEFLKSYLAYFLDRGLHVGCIQNFFKLNQEGNNIYPDFRPTKFIDAMNITHTNRWTDKLRSLAERFVRYLDLKEDTVQEFLDVISNSHIYYKRLEFSGIRRILMWHYKNRPYYTDERELLSIPQDPVYCYKPQGTTTVTKELLQLPFEKQPWFFGNLTQLEIKQIFERFKNNKDVFITTFFGAQLLCMQRVNKKWPIYGKRKKGFPTFAILNNSGIAKDWDLHQFYLRLIENDLEGMKKLQSIHGFDWSTLSLRQTEHCENNTSIAGTQPHPLVEYLNAVDDIRQDVVEWLFQLCPLNNICVRWDKNDFPAHHRTIFQRIVKHGGSFDAENWLKYVKAIMPKHIVDSHLKHCTNFEYDVKYKNLVDWEKIFDEYRSHMKQQRIISETNMAILLAWKHADGESIGFRNLPKELIRLIVDFIDEPPLTRVFAKILVGRFKYLELFTVGNYRIRDWIKKYSWAIEFLAKDKGFRPSLYEIDVESSMDYSKFMKMKHWLLEIAIRNKKIKGQFRSLFFKHEEDIPNLEKYWAFVKQKHVDKNLDESEIQQKYASISLLVLQAKNRTFLNFLMNKSAFRMPKKEEFTDDSSYEAALIFIADVEKERNQNLKK